MATQEYGYRSEPSGLGWVTFAGIMLTLAGTFNVIDGIVAVSRSKFFVASATYVFSDLHTWGWIILVVGAFQIVAGYAIFTGSELARWFGIVTAGVNVLAQLGFTHAYPFWSLCMIALDLIVIYALAAYGGARLRTR
jgi:predicted membrane metal-binding protein